MSFNIQWMKKQSRKKETADLCTLCALPSYQHPKLLSTALYNKYTAMTEYRSYQELNDIISGEHTRMADALKDLMAFRNAQECLKRYHSIVVGTQKAAGLFKYYKYHVSLPQCHLTNVDTIIQRWQHLQLRLYYKNIKKQLNMEVSRTEESSNKQQSSSGTYDDQRRTYLLRELLEQSKEVQQRQLREKQGRELIKSESKALYDVLRVIGSNPTLDSQSYLKEDFMEISQDSRSRERFENFIDEHHINFGKRQSDQLAMKISSKEKGTFLKNHISEFKSVSQMVKESQGQQVRPKLTFKKHPKRKDDSPEWSPIYNFINNFLNDAVSPGHKKTANSQRQGTTNNIQTQESEFRSTKFPSQLIKKQALQSYQTAMPQIQPRNTSKSKDKPKVELPKEAGSELLQTAIRHQSLTSHRNSGPNTGEKVKTQTRVSKPKALSLERIKTVMPSSVKSLNGATQRNGIRTRLLGKSPLSQQFLAVGRLTKKG